MSPTRKFPVKLVDLASLRNWGRSGRPADDLKTNQHLEGKFPVKLVDLASLRNSWWNGGPPPADEFEITQQLQGKFPVNLVNLPSLRNWWPPDHANFTTSLADLSTLDGHFFILSVFSWLSLHPWLSCAFSSKQCNLSIHGVRCYNVTFLSKSMVIRSDMLKPSR